MTEDLMLAIHSGNRRAVVASPDELTKIATYGFNSPVTIDVITRIVGLAALFRADGDGARLTEDLWVEPPVQERVSA